MSEKIRPMNLRRMAGGIASAYNDDGAIVISVGEDGTRIGVEGLSPERVRNALCVAINYSYEFPSDFAKEKDRS